MGENNSKLGYQGSEHSRGELIIYPQGSDPVVSFSTSPIKFTGKQIWDSEHGLLSIQTHKVLGQCSGTWSAVIKYSKAIDDLFRMVTDDDWVDINFYRHGKKWHVMRGLINDIRYHEDVSGDGATVRTFTLSGSDWMSIFERTPLWFSTYTDTGILEGVARRLFDTMDNGVGAPNKAVQVFLFGFLATFASTGRAVWNLPKAMPIATSTSAAQQNQTLKDISSALGIAGVGMSEAIGTTRQFGVIAGQNFDDSGFVNNPVRQGLGVNYLQMSGNLWGLAQEWSDPMFCELYGDTVLPLQDQTVGESSPDTTVMQVTIRNRPFLVGDPLTGYPTGLASPYFSLPKHYINPEDITSMDLGRTGAERFNMFLLSPQTTQETANSNVDLAAPLWSSSDILYHGVRRFDITSRYVVTGTDQDLISMSQKQRYLLRDWHCLNPYLLNGNIFLGRGFPQIHIGERVLVYGVDRDHDRTFYVEAVSNTWSFGGTIKTALGVTRGWEGSDTSYVQALADTTVYYTLPLPTLPGAP